MQAQFKHTHSCEGSCNLQKQGTNLKNVDMVTGLIIDLNNFSASGKLLSSISSDCNGKDDLSDSDLVATSDDGDTCTEE
jgi:hypothetical protein